MGNNSKEKKTERMGEREMRIEKRQGGMER